MSSSNIDEVFAKKVYFQDDYLCVVLGDDRIISVPYRVFPRLANASKEQLNNFKVGRIGIHWPDLDEDIEIKGLLAPKIRIAPGSAQWKPHSWKERLEAYEKKRKNSA